MTSHLLIEIEKFLINEARILDERRWGDWLGLFAEDGWYWVPVEEGQTDPKNTVSLMYDDRQLLETRVRRLAAGTLHTQMPISRTSRIVTNATIEEQAGDTQIVRSKFQMIEYRRNKQRNFGGTQWHALEKAGDGFLLKWKKVELVNCDSMMDGLTIPF